MRVCTTTRQTLMIMLVAKMEPFWIHGSNNNYHTYHSRTEAGEGSMERDVEDPMKERGKAVAE